MATGRTKLQGLNDQVRDAAAYALDIADYYGIPVQVTSGFRSWEEQTKLYQRYQSGGSAFPANRPGDSAHNFGLAFDSVVAPEYQAAWDWIRRYVGFEVLPNDIIHGQVPNWRQYTR